LNAACIRPCARQSKRACTSAPPKSPAKKFARNICCRGVLASISRSRWQCGHRTFNASSRRAEVPTAAIGNRLSNTPARSLLRDHGNLHRPRFCGPTHQLCDERYGQAAADRARRSRLGQGGAAELAGTMAKQDPAGGITMIRTDNVALGTLRSRLASRRDRG
jgi:hypothetical protein